MSLAYGDFFQNANNGLLKFSPELETQNTQHYIMNYQHVTDGRIFRAELYRKDYDNLVKFDTEMAGFAGRVLRRKPRPLERVEPRSTEISVFGLAFSQQCRRFANRWCIPRHRHGRDTRRDGLSAHRPLPSPIGRRRCHWHAYRVFRRIH